MRLLVLAVATLLPTLANAALDPQTIAVAPMASPSDLIGIAGLLAHEGQLEAAKQPGAKVLTPDQVEAALGAAGLKRLATCDLTAPCASAELQPLGAGRALLGSLDRDDVHYVVRLALIDVASGTSLAGAERTVLIAGRTLEGEVAAMLPDVLAGKSQLPAKVTITCNARHARATLDDAPLGETPITISVSPGKHEVKVEKANYLPTSRFVEVGVGEAQTIPITITLLPNHIDPDADVPAPAPSAVNVASTAPEESHPGRTMMIGSVVAAGVAVAALGVGIGFGVGAHNLQAQAVDTTGDGALSITRVQALQGQTDATVANVCYVGAGVVAAAAVTLFFLSNSSDSSPSPGPKVAAGPIPGGAAVALGGSF